MGDTANSSWNSRALGGQLRREAARKAEQGEPQPTLRIAELLAESAASKYEGILSTAEADENFRKRLQQDLEAMYMAGLRSANGWELFGPDGALVERTARCCEHVDCKCQVFRAVESARPVTANAEREAVDTGQTYSPSLADQVADQVYNWYVALQCYPPPYLIRDKVKELIEGRTNQAGALTAEIICKADRKTGSLHMQNHEEWAEEMVQIINLILNGSESKP